MEKRQHNARLNTKWKRNANTMHYFLYTMQTKYEFFTSTTVLTVLKHLSLEGRLLSMMRACCNCKCNIAVAVTVDIKGFSLKWADLFSRRALSIGDVSTYQLELYKCLS